MKLTKNQKYKYLLFYPLASGVLAYLFQSLLDWNFGKIDSAIGFTIGFFAFWWGWALTSPQTLPDNQKKLEDQSDKNQVVRSIIFYVIILVVIIVIAIWLGDR